MAKITAFHYDNNTNEYDNITFTDCTDNENNIDIIISTLLLTILCSLTFTRLMSLMRYTSIKPLKNK